MWELDATRQVRQGEWSIGSDEGSDLWFQVGGKEDGDVGLGEEECTRCRSQAKR